MSAAVDTDGNDQQTLVFRCMRDGLAPAVLETVVKAAVCINLVPTTSDFSKAPNRSDIEEHFKLLASFMTCFPDKAPSLSMLVGGLCSLDDFYRKSLSKTNTKRGQQAWAAIDAHSIKLLAYKTYHNRGLLDYLGGAGGRGESPHTGGDLITANFPPGRIYEYKESASRPVVTGRGVIAGPLPSYFSERDMFLPLEEVPSRPPHPL